jgi:hypothetical protein
MFIKICFWSMKCISARLWSRPSFIFARLNARQSFKEDESQCVLSHILFNCLCISWTRHFHYDIRVFDSLVLSGYIYLIVVQSRRLLKQKRQLIDVRKVSPELISERLTLSRFHEGSVLSENAFYYLLRLGRVGDNLFCC